MGHHQTKTHRRGKHSYHQIGLVRGQFGNVPEDAWLDWIAETGFDGWEEASWELDLNRCGDDAGAKAYAAERVAKAKKRGLEILSVAAHLQGQALGDEPSAKTMQFLGGESVEAYARWRAAGNNPPRTDPFYVPPEVAEIARRQADRGAGERRAAGPLHRPSWKIAWCRSRASSARRPIAGAIGFCFRRCPVRWADIRFPTCYKVSLELLVERFAPVFQACLKYGTTFDLECHPSERAMGDIASAGDYLAAVDAAGFAKAAGFNFDCSHMEWQGVSGVDFIRAYGDRIHCAHIKGVQVIDGYTRNGRLGGHRPMGDKHNGWNFVTAGTARDATSTEAAVRRAESGRLQRRRVDRMGRQRRRAARRRQSGAGQRAPRRPAPQRHAARRAVESLNRRHAIEMPLPIASTRPPQVDPTPIFELFRGNYGTELLTAAVAHFRIFERLAAGPLASEMLRCAAWAWPSGRSSC